MMRVSKVVGAVVVGLAASVALLAPRESRADGDADLVDFKCVNGNLEAKGVGTWHVNDEAPWKWDKGSKVSVNKKGNLAVLKGDKCEGTLKAYVCEGTSQCKGPISVAIKDKPNWK